MKSLGVFKQAADKAASLLAERLVLTYRSNQSHSIVRREG